MDAAQAPDTLIGQVRRHIVRRAGLPLAIAALVASSQLASAHDSGFGLARYTPDGALDAGFGSGGVVVIRSAQQSFVANALALQPNGEILIAGMASDLPTATIQLALARFEPDGSPDHGFGANGMAATPVGAAGAEATALAIQPDGRIVVAGTAYAHGASQDQFVLARYTPQGKPDPTFGTNGLTTTHVGQAAAGVQALALQPDGRILVAGTAFANGATDDDFALVRYTSDGNLDAEFGSGGVVTTDFGGDSAGAGDSLDRAGGIALQLDGKILVAGATRGAHQTFAVARYDTDGRLDASFGNAGKAQVAASEPQVHAVVVQPGGGDLVLAGSATTSSGKGSAPFTLLRLKADGSPDETFGVHGLASTSFEGSRSGARAVVAQPDGKLLSGGAKYGAPSAQGDALPESGFALARYSADGTVDASFGTNGKALTDMGDAGATPLSLVVQPDGKIVAAGLVFFRVVVADQPVGPLEASRRLAAPAAIALALIVSAGAFGLRVKRGRRG